MSSWSLRARVMRWVVVSTFLVVASSWALGTWFVRGSIEREFSALLQEEVDEMKVLFRTSERTRSDFSRFAEELRAEHPANPMAWRVWDLETGEVWGDFGARRLLEDFPVGDAPGTTRIDRRDAGWKEERFEGDLQVGLLLDGKAQASVLARFQALFAVLALAAAVLLIGGGAVFSRRTASLLEQVADRVRTAQPSSESADLGVRGAPDEIRDVSEAFEELLSRIRGEQERAKLLTAGIAHEMRSPIQNLLGETEVALLRERDAAEYRRVLESSYEELCDLGRVVDNLVSLCSTGLDLQSSGWESFDFGREADLQLGRERRRAERKGVEIRMRTAGDLACEGDRHALLLAVRNLVGNAIDWSPSGGAVDVSLEGRNGGLEITVDDCGPGVRPEVREEILKPFYTAPPAEGRRAGFGLGLALAKQAVLAQGGEIEVADSPVGGARFQVRLPRREAPARADAT